MPDWRQYVDLVGFSAEREKEVAEAMDNLWADPDSRGYILRAFQNNGNEPVKVYNPTIELESNGNNYTFDLPSHMSGREGYVAIGLAERTASYSDEDGNVHGTDEEQTLFHEFYHAAYAQSQNEYSIRMQLYAAGIPAEEENITVEDLDYLKQAEIISAEEHAAFLERIENGETLSFRDIDETPGGEPRLSKTQITDFLNHRFEDTMTHFRDFMEGRVLDNSQIHQLYRIGALTYEDMQDVVRRLAEGEELTLSDLEEDYGALEWYHVYQFTENLNLPGFASGLESLLGGDDAQAGSDLGSSFEIMDRILEPMQTAFTIYKSALIEHEERTTDATDDLWRSERGIPHRRSYDNALPPSDQSEEDPSLEESGVPLSPSIPTGP